MKKLISIGEALIDFIPGQTNCKIKDVCDFKPIVGGAPANVAGAFAKLGGRASLITQLGNDPFGDKILADFKKYSIGCEYVRRTDEANTSLAFVSLQDDGNREFSFYRKPGADMLLSPDDIKEEWFEDTFALHFCSVSLGNFPMKEAHKKAIEYAEKNKAIISFDPNLRLPLWDSKEELKEAVLEFIPKANVIKISDEELEFITGYTDINEALDKLFVGNVKLVIYTKGNAGAEAYTRTNKAAREGEKVRVVDTTGAGDSFIGAFLYCLYKGQVDSLNISDLSESDLGRYLGFSNRYSGLSVTKKGAIASYPTMEDL